MNWIGPEPQARVGQGGRRPVVALLDTGVAEHPWLRDEHVTRDPKVLGQLIGLGEPSAAERASGVSDAMVGELRSTPATAPSSPGSSGRRAPTRCSSTSGSTATTGVVTESAPAPEPPAPRPAPGAARTGDPDLTVDVVTLSLGYYHEHPGDAAFDALLHGPLALLGEYGAAVVVSAGNDASPAPSTRPRSRPTRTDRRGPPRVVSRHRGRRAQPRRHHRALQQRRPLGARSAGPAPRW